MQGETLSDKTKAVMIAHTLGNPFDLQTVWDFCDKHDLWLVEDNCDALGTQYEYNGKWCPSGNDDTCKHRFKQRFGELPLGYDHKYVYSHLGYNLKVTDMQAAIGCAQLEKMPEFIFNAQGKNH